MTTTSFFVVTVGVSCWGIEKRYLPCLSLSLSQKVRTVLDLCKELAQKHLLRKCLASSHPASLYLT